MSSDVFDLPCAESTKAALRSLTASPPRGHLVLITGPPGDLPLACAVALAANLVSPAAQATDVRLAAPAKDRWTVDEVSELIIAPAHLRPVERTIVVVAAADDMDTPAAEHLLKVVEEPPSNALFLFVATNLDALLPTLRSRASAVVVVEGLSALERIDRLVDAGADKAVAAEVVGLCGHLSALSHRAASDPTLLAALRVAFGAPLRAAHPTTTAFNVASALETLTVGELVAGIEPARLPSAKSAAAKKKIDPAQKARIRMLARHVLDARRDLVSSALRGDLTAASFARLRRHAAAIDQAEAELRGFANPAHVLAALLSRTS